MLTQEQIDTFKKEGVLVVFDILSSDEIQYARNNLHNQLKKYDIDHDRILKADPEMLNKLQGPRIKSCTSNMFYPKWKLDIALHPKVWDVTRTLWKETFAKNLVGFDHPFGRFNPNHGYAFIDRICYRLPDSIQAEGGLLPHIDRNPHKPYENI